VLLSLPAWWPGPSTARSWFHGEAGIRLQSVSLPPPAPPTLFRSVDQMARPRAAEGGRECPLICCVMRPVNGCLAGSDAHNIG